MMNNEMTVRELIEILQEHDGDAPVRIATQPSWPLAHLIGNVVSAGPEDDEYDEESIVWISTGEHPQDSPHAPSGAFDN